MAPLPYSTRLALGNYNGVAVIYTVPAGAIAIVQSIDVANLNDAPGQGFIAVLTVSTGPVPFFVFTGIGAVSSVHWEGKQVLSAGDQIASDTSAVMGVTISGAVLTL